MRCQFCGAENAEDTQFCVRCGNPMGAAPADLYPKIVETKIPTRLIILLIIVVITAFIILPAILYIMVLGIGNAPMMAVIAMTPSATATDWVFTVVSIAGDNMFKSNIYVIMTDQNGTYTIHSDPLVIASGTAGFTYAPMGSGPYIAIGDTFSLSLSRYGPGSQLLLVNAGASYIYGSGTVY